MKICTKSATDNEPLAPNKRVHHAFGMVMGVDEFQQEQAHFEWKHRLSNRLLHGYGTVCGLRVSKREASDSGDVQIAVSRGYAISPRGRWIWVEHDQCMCIPRRRISSHSAVVSALLAAKVSS